ncbi:MAG: AAA family ATPase [Bacteroidales bacterium]|nr:AAA family ATPase [Bacteroidales bacterium]
MFRKPSDLKPLPVSTQEFSVIREEGKMYVDKTDLVWQMANGNEDVIFFSRPRRFGKTLLVSTFEAYFNGQKDLFEGLKIMELEKDWKKYEVLRFDLSGCISADSFLSKLNLLLTTYEERYSVNCASSFPGDRLHNLIEKISSGRNVVLLVDEYDYALQHTVFGDENEHERIKGLYRDFFAVFKTQSRYIRFIFLTGITKFTRLSIFSVLNNIKVIGFWPEYQAICGITEEEAHTTLRPYVMQLSEKMRMTEEQTYQAIKDRYDGYHFCEDGIDIYNPYSLINALNDMRIRNYWASSGGTKMLMDAVDKIGWDTKEFENIPVRKDFIEDSDANGHDLPLFLYQSGYLTIKGAVGRNYILGLPNTEVKTAMYEQILPRLVKKPQQTVDANINGIWQSLYDGNAEEAFDYLKALVADTPYSQDNSANAMEEKFRFIVKNAMHLAGCFVDEEKQTATGRIDLVCRYDTCILVIELKMTDNGGLEAATQQIADRAYLAPYLAQNKPIYAVALEFDAGQRGMTRYKVTKVK